jgi:eukaryotic-like serine/threonine-protein kinase
LPPGYEEHTLDGTMSSDHSDLEIDRLARSRIGSLVAGKWTLQSLVGIGGMGAVYRAQHRNGSVQAIKIMHRELISNDGHVERFFREAQFANRIGHPAVLQVFDDGQLEDGCPYLVTELLSGRDLEDERVARGGTLPLAEVISIGFQILDVLDKAHTIGLLHRDLKPVNLFRTDKGEIRVLDFGLGRDLAEGPGGRRKMTSAFVVMGTVGFMSPEQARGKREEIGPQTDLWALGATMLMLATGLETHEADSPMEILGLTATKPLPKTSTRTKLMPAFCKFLDQALAFKMADRFADAKAMRRALEVVHDKVPNAPTRQQDPASLKKIAANGVATSMVGMSSDAVDSADARTLIVKHKAAAWSIRTKRMVVGLGATGAVLSLVVLALVISVLRTKEDAEHSPASSAKPETTLSTGPGAAKPVLSAAKPSATEIVAVSPSATATVPLDAVGPGASARPPWADSNIQPPASVTAPVKPAVTWVPPGAGKPPKPPVTASSGSAKIKDLNTFDK